MNGYLTWLPSVLEAAGLKWAPVDGWQTRGRGPMGDVAGVICHTTVGPRHGNMPSLRVLIEGRADLAGPLAQLGLGRDGTYYVIAAGRCNHAGKGTWNGINAGNTRFIGIEAENTGLGDEPWPDIQIQAYQHGVGAILKHLGLNADCCCGHKEWALPAGRKQDPDFGQLLPLTTFRSAVQDFIEGRTSPRPPIPRLEPGTGRATLRRGASGPLVMALQQKLAQALSTAPVGALADGEFGPRTEAAVREFQRRNGLVPDGIVGPKTWAALPP